jgi:hypothetical protein
MSSVVNGWFPRAFLAERRRSPSLHPLGVAPAKAQIPATNAIACSGRRVRNDDCPRGGAEAQPVMLRCAELVSGKVLAP